MNKEDEQIMTMTIVLRQIYIMRCHAPCNLSWLAAINNLVTIYGSNTYFIWFYLPFVIILNILFDSSSSIDIG